MLAITKRPMLPHESSFKKEAAAARQPIPAKKTRPGEMQFDQSGPGEPAPHLTGLCPSCGLPRLGANTTVIVEEVVIENHEETEPFGLVGEQL